MRNAASIFYEDYLVAKHRFVAAVKRNRKVTPGRRPFRIRTKTAAADIETHRETLALYHRLLTEAGGVAVLSPDTKLLAERIAGERVGARRHRGQRSGDAVVGRCLCGSGCGRKWPS